MKMSRLQIVYISLLCVGAMLGSFFLGLIIQTEKGPEIATTETPIAEEVTTQKPRMPKPSDVWAWGYYFYRVINVQKNLVCYEDIETGEREMVTLSYFMIGSQRVGTYEEFKQIECYIK